MRFLPPIMLLGFWAASALPADPADQLPPASNGKTWHLVWHDEFNGTQLDQSKWDVPDNKRRDG